MSVLLAASSSSSLSEVLEISFAAVGGIIVFLGLFLEKKAEWKSEKHIVKPCKRLSEWGWWILMIGIGIEIGVAGWSAKDAWETRQMAIKSEPLNQPVSDISARVVVKLEGTNFETINDPFDLRGENWVMLLDNETNISSLDLGKIGQLMAEDVLPFLGFRYPDRRIIHRGYVMKYVENPLEPEYFGTEPPESRPAAKYLLGKVRFLRISPGFIQKDQKVLGGEAWITINGTLRAKFLIYPQGMDTNFQQWNPEFKTLVFLATNCAPRIQ